MQYEILNGESMLEREIENLLEQILRNCGWIVDVGVKNRQVYRQQPRSTDEINKLKVNGIQTFPDFILYEDENIAVPIAVIEAKRVENKNLEKAKEQGLNYAKALGARFLFLYNANRFIAYYVPTEEVLLIDNEEVINDFFDKVIINDENTEIKNNRISLLKKLEKNTDKILNL